VADLQKQIAKFRLLGPQNKEDLLLEFAINSGKLVVPDGPVYRYEDWYTNDQYRKAFNRGLFNPRKNVGAPLGFNGTDRVLHGKPALLGPGAIQFGGSFSDVPSGFKFWGSKANPSAPVSGGHVFKSEPIS
jgi:hypothetical protein